MEMLNPVQFRQSGGFWRKVSANAAITRGANISSAGRHNRKIILDAIRAQGEMTCGNLAELTGLTPPAVFNIAKGLVSEGWVIRSRSSEKARGQPSHTLKLNPNAAFALGLNIDRDHLTLIVVDFAGRVQRRFHIEIHFAGPQEVRTFVIDSINRLEHASAAQVARIVGLGVAIPDDLGRTVLPGQPQRYQDWNEICLPDLLGDIIDAPVVQENDAGAAVIGEMQFGAGLELTSFFYVFISAGLGGGLVINKQYVRGAHGRSGEIGFLPQISPLRPSKTKLQNSLGDAVLVSDLLRSLRSHGYENPSIDDLEHLTEQGEVIVNHWIDAVADFLYLPLLTVICTVDPEAVLVGGRLPRSITERLCYQVNRRLSMHVGSHWPGSAVRPALVVTDAAAVGAAVLAFQCIWDQEVRQPSDEKMARRVVA
jgi:predicted NBD/HSP70 family sugar kinase